MTDDVTGSLDVIISGVNLTELGALFLVNRQLAGTLTRRRAHHRQLVHAQHRRQHQAARRHRRRLRVPVARHAGQLPQRAGTGGRDPDPVARLEAGGDREHSVLDHARRAHRAADDDRHHERRHRPRGARGRQHRSGECRRPAGRGRARHRHRQQSGGQRIGPRAAGRVHGGGHRRRLQQRQHRRDARRPGGAGDAPAGRRQQRRRAPGHRPRAAREPGGARHRVRDHRQRLHRARQRARPRVGGCEPQSVRDDSSAESRWPGAAALGAARGRSDRRSLCVVALRARGAPRHHREAGTSPARCRCRSA